MNPTPPFNLMQWIEDHRDEFTPPVMNKQFYKEADDVIVFVSVGPNTRNDYHVNPTVIRELERGRFDIGAGKCVDMA